MRLACINNQEEHKSLFHSILLTEHFAHISKYYMSVEDQVDLLSISTQTTLEPYTPEMEEAHWVVNIVPCKYSFDSGIWVDL